MYILSKFSTCYEPCERFLKLSQLDLLSQCFNIDKGLLADEPKLPICKSHNLEFLTFLKKCSFCKALMNTKEHNVCRKSPDFEGIVQHLKNQNQTIPECFTADSGICNKCFGTIQDSK